MRPALRTGLPALLLLAVAVFGAGPALGEEPGTTASDLDIQVNFVRIAAEQDDAESMATLAAQDEPDPWLVADRLCALGAFDAALQFARAAPRPDTEMLPAYVERARDAGRLLAGRLTMYREKVAARAPGYRVPDGTTVPGLILHGYKAQELVEDRRTESAESLLVQGAEKAVALGWLVQASYFYQSAADLARRRGDAAQARAALGGLYNTNKRRGRPAAVFRALLQLGAVHHQTGQAEEALKLYERAQDVAEESGLPARVAEAWRATSRVHAGQGKYEDARAALDRALEVSESLDDDAAIATALGDLAALQAMAGDGNDALGTYAKVLEMRDRMDDADGVIATHRAVAELQESLSRYNDAVRSWDLALRRVRTTQDRETEADLLVRLGDLYRRTGKFGRALGTLEQASGIYEELGLDGEKARVTARIATVHMERRDIDAAQEAYGAAMGEMERLGGSDLLTETHNEMSELCRLAGDGSGAVECSKRAAEGARRNGDLVGEATAVLNGGLAELELGDVEQARVYAERALALFEEAKHREGRARALVQLGDVHTVRKNLPEALSSYADGVALAESLGLTGVEIDGRWSQAEAFMLAGDPERALETVRQAVLKLPELLRGFSELRGAVARTSYAPLFSLGLGAAVALDDDEAASYFLESGRAGAFLEMLKNNAELQDALIRPELRVRLEKARARVVRARKVLLEARGTRRRVIIRFVKEHLEEAERQEREAIRRVQREEKAIARVMYPTADPLAVIQDRLNPAEVLVVYGRATQLEPESGARREFYVALVVGSHATELVRLGSAATIEGALAAARPSTAGEDVTGGVRAARQALIDPLRLGVSTRRVLVSPDGPIAFAPLGMLFERHEVCLVPSGTTLGFLEQEKEKRGSRVLALADPDYSSLIGAETLPSLPYTRKEAEALGDELLLGADATESLLRTTLAAHGDGRWRGVHLACHGSVDEEQPLYSQLVVTPDESTDGYLTAADLYGMQIPTDVVSLSACETGRGKMLRAEGVLGLVRGFMLAGAPRVVSSLWKVDDKATRALMVEFYRRFDPKDGSEGAGAASALKAAQEHVRRQPGWEHPWYWAGWVLWGLGD